MQPFITLMLAQHRQAELIAESRARVLSPSARPSRRGLFERIRRAFGDADYPALELPTLTNYPYRP